MGIDRQVAGFLLGLCLLAPLGAGEVFEPLTPLASIETEHFTFIFAPGSYESAQHLAAWAEEIVVDLESRLGQELTTRIPVSLSPHSSLLNGWAGLVPYPRIVLYDTALDTDWTTFDDTIKGVFIHELSHILSLGSRTAWAEFMAGIFGNWFSPTALNSPQFMVEGVTVLQESIDGRTGRASDPLVRQRLRQDAFEGRFKDTTDLRGTFDRYPGASLYYEYGGLFNHFLLESWGEEQYRKLWKSMGEVDIGAILSLDTFGSIFLKVYGVRLSEAWDSFRKTWISDTIVPVEPIEGMSLIPAEAPELLRAGDYLWWVDPRSGAVYSWKPGIVAPLQRGNLGRQAELSSWIPQGGDAGSFLLSTHEVLPDGRHILKNGIFKADTGTISTIFPEEEGLREPQFIQTALYGTAIVGIKVRQYQTDLVIREGNGVDHVVLRGNPTRYFTKPRVLADGRLALVVIEEGERFITLIDLETQTAEALIMAPSSVRDLSISNGKIWFNAVMGDSFYRAGYFDGDQVFFTDTDHSGGVFKPLEMNGELFAFGRFSRGTALVKLDTTSIPLVPQPFELRQFNQIFHEPEPDPREFTALKSVPYEPLAWANPFSSWFLYPDIVNIAYTWRYYGAFLLADPMGENNVLLQLGHDIPSQMADLGFTWQGTSLPVRMALSFRDTVHYEPGENAWRSLELQGSLAYDQALPWSDQGLGITISGLARQPAPNPGTGLSAYQWPWAPPGGLVSTTLGWNYGAIPSEPGRPAGFSLNLSEDLSLPSLSLRSNLVLNWGLDPIPARVYGFASWSDTSDLGLDGEGGYFSLPRFQPYREFMATNGRFGLVDWRIFGADLGLQLVNLEVNDQWLLLYVQRFLVELGYRGALFNQSWLHSTYLRLTARTALAPAMGSFGFRGWAEAYLRLNDLQNPDENPLGIQFGLVLPEFGL